VDRLTLEIGQAAFEDREYYAGTTRAIIASREVLTRGLLDQGFQVLPSLANFVFAAKQGVPGRRIYEGLRENGILVRHFSSPGIEDFVRITIGRPGDIELLLKKTRELFG
jgi:histidinol-phosphate aminotransferase